MIFVLYILGRTVHKLICIHLNLIAKIEAVQIGYGLRKENGIFLAKKAIQFASKGDFIYTMR